MPATDRSDRTKPSAHPRALAAGALVVAVLAFALQVRDLAAAAGFKIPGLPFAYGGSLLDNLFAVAIALAAAAWLSRHRRDLWRDLGLVGNGWRGPALTAFASLPCWIGLAWLGSVSSEWSWLDLLMLAVLYPLLEEIVFRGFGFVFVGRALAWRRPAAYLVQALAFGAVHWWSAGAEGALAWQIFAITFSGSLVFAALDALDGDSIYSGWVLHVSLNAAWTVFAVSDTAATGWVGNCLRFGSAGLALAGLWLLRRRALARAAKP